MTTLQLTPVRGATMLTLDEAIPTESLAAILDAIAPDTILRYGTFDSPTIFIADDAGHEAAEVYDVALGESLRIVNDGLTGSRTLRLETGHGIEAGDQIWITSEIAADPAEYPGIDDWGGTVTVSFLVTVERVGGNSIALEERLPFDLDAGSLAVQTVESVEAGSFTGFSSDETSGAGQEPGAGDVIDVAAGTSLVDLQEIVDNAADGSVIRLEAGTYTFDAALEITRSNITLEGAGTGETIIVATSASAGAPTIQVGPSIYNADLGDPIALTETAAAGSSTLRLESGHGLEVGDRIWISRENTEAYFEEIGDTEWQEDAELRTFLVEVANVGGNSVSLTEALPFEFTPSESTVQTIGMLDDVSISGITLANTYGTSDPSDFSNTINAETRAVALSVSGTDGLSLSDIEISEAASHGFALAKTINAEVDNLWVHGAQNKGSGGNGYALWIRDVYHSAFTNLTLEDSRHGVLFSSYTSATDNYVHVSSTNRDINFHGGQDQDNVVVVDALVREGEEQAYLGTTLFINEGESYGAPTDPEANEVSFAYVVGTVRQDLIYADDGGAEIHSSEAADTIYTAAGDDFVFAESGHDMLYASAGDDFFDGGSGSDTLIFGSAASGYAISQTADGVKIANWAGTTEAVDIETFIFDGMTYSESDLIG